MLTNLGKPLYSYNDVTIVPAEISSVTSRSECNPFLPSGTLPVFTAPMSSVVSRENFGEWRKNNIIPIAPRNIEWEVRKNLLLSGEWVAVGLSGFKIHFIDYPISDSQPLKVCIDIANGHMREVLDLVGEAKTINPNLIVMAGNIANPKTIEDYCETGIDFVRIGIGGGSGCITSSNTGIHYPMASLISDTRNWRDGWEHLKGKRGTKIIADGGIRGYGDIIKALALGADRVMIGGLLAKCLEAAGDIRVSFPSGGPTIENYSSSDFSLSYSEGKFYVSPTEFYLKNHPNGLMKSTSDKVEVKLYRRFYGMASRQGQRDINGGIAEKTAEGIEKTVPVTITLPGWVENLTHYLRSAMSYLSIRQLSDFYMASSVRVMTPTSYLAINP